MGTVVDAAPIKVSFDHVFTSYIEDFPGRKFCEMFVVAFFLNENFNPEFLIHFLLIYTIEI